MVDGMSGVQIGTGATVHPDAFLRQHLGQPTCEVLQLISDCEQSPFPRHAAARLAPNPNPNPLPQSSRRGDRFDEVRTVQTGVPGNQCGHSRIVYKCHTKACSE
jgi:hypothetical protein